MKHNTRNPAPLLITALAVAFVSFLYVLGEVTKDNENGSFSLDIFDRLESITYDARVRMAADYLEANSIAPNLATLFIDDSAIELVNEGVYGRYMAAAWDDMNLEGLNFDVPWPRFLYGQMVREIHAQGARAIGFDIIMSESDRKSSETDIALTETNKISSDAFFAQQIAEAGTVILATEGELLPQKLFADRSAALASIASRNDFGVLRRVKAFAQYKDWHPLVTNQANALDLRLHKADWKTPGFLKIPFRPDPDDPTRAPFKIPLLPNGNLMLTKNGELNLDADKNDLGPQDQPPYKLKRAWNLGLALAAMELGADLDKASIEIDRIILQGSNDVRRIIPTDHEHRFYIDWSLRFDDIKRNKTPVLFGSPLTELVHDFGRQYEGTNDWENIFTNRLVIVGSVATGNNLTDHGATPLEADTPLVTKHLNIANSILTGRFIQKTSIIGTIALVLALGFLSGWATWRAKVFKASILIAVIACIYVLGAFYLYIQHRYWLPIVMPLFGGLLLPHFALVTYRVIFEQKEQRHIKSLFQRLVAPEIVQEVLRTEDLNLGGARRDISVYFADVRGFTEFTDFAHAAAAEYVKKKNMTSEEAEAYYDKQAAETMETINLYLGTVSAQVKKHQGTLDKYIGDCVMAFWGAPTDQERHALGAVRAAIDSQRAVFAINQERAKENTRRSEENHGRAERGEELFNMLPLLSIGSGINSGPCIVGMMGSERDVISYTVFGREVNLASRLEGVSGRGRIIVSQRTYDNCKKFDPDLAATFVELESVKVKGIRDPVRIYEVPWKLPDHSGGSSMITKSNPASDTQYHGMNNA